MQHIFLKSGNPITIQILNLQTKLAILLYSSKYSIDYDMKNFKLQ